MFLLRNDLVNFRILKNCSPPPQKSGFAEQNFIAREVLVFCSLGGVKRIVLRRGLSLFGRYGLTISHQNVNLPPVIRTPGLLDGTTYTTVPY